MSENTNQFPVDPGSYDVFSSLEQRKILFSCSTRALSKIAVPVFVQRLSEEIRSGPSWYKHVRYPFLALELILSGNMNFLADDQSLIAGPGSLYVIAPGTTVRFACCSGQNVQKLCAIFSGENLKGFLGTLHLARPRILKFPEPELIEEKMRSLREAVESDIFENSARSCRFLLELAKNGNDDFSDMMPFQKAVSIMESNFGEALQIPAIAARAGVSGNTLRRMFQREFHCSPLDYLNIIRMKFAAGKLQRTTIPVKEIAQLSGFGSAARFSAAFAEKYKMSPTEFRKKVQTEKPG